MSEPVPSWLVSDGTLRLLALTLLAYLPEQDSIYLIEEPENGIHPKAVEGVFQSLSSVYQGQVLVATHSPLFLGLAEPSQLLCFAKNPSGAVDIVSGDKHPALQNWRGEMDLCGILFLSACADAGGVHKIVRLWWLILSQKFGSGRPRPLWSKSCGLIGTRYAALRGKKAIGRTVRLNRTARKSCCTKCYAASAGHPRQHSSNPLRGVSAFRAAQTLRLYFCATPSQPGFPTAERISPSSTSALRPQS